MLDMLFQYLNLDCLSLICSKISYIDNISFRFTCKYYKNIPLPKFRNIFIKRLLQHNIVPSYEDALKFCDNLYNTGAYVAGSFILDCLYDTNYHQDIDIYDQTNPVNLHGGYNKLNDRFDNFGDNNLKFTQSLYNLEFKSMDFCSGPDLIVREFLHKSSYKKIKDEIIFQYLESFPFDKCDILLENDLTTCTLYDAMFRYYSKLYPYKNYNFRKELSSNKIKNKIQIIPIGLTLKENERSFIPRFISASFDLEICQSLFDGKKLYIKNLDKLMNKYDFIKPNTRFMLSVYPQDDELEEILTIKRMNKYIERGFDIKLHSCYNEIDIFIKDTLKSYKYASEDKYHQYNIKYIDNGEIDLSKYDY
jgi:hypothetical protein